MRMNNLRFAAVAYIIIGAAALASDIFLKDSKSEVLFIIGLTFIALGSVIEMLRNELKNIHIRLDQNK